MMASFALADVIRPESREAITKLHEMGVQVAMLTGDSQAVAREVAEELGIDTYFAEVLGPIGILLSPAVGAILMSLSTVIVAINAQLLRKTAL